LLPLGLFPNKEAIDRMQRYSDINMRSLGTNGHARAWRASLDEVLRQAHIFAMRSVDQLPTETSLSFFVLAQPVPRAMTLF
jgi:hypothetical protein